MNFNSIMHVSFYAKDLEKIREFYEDKLGCKAKMLVRNYAYKDKPDHGFYKQAISDPNGITLVYFEVAPGQFIEFFPAREDQEPAVEYNKHVGYAHFSLTVDDIHKTRDELIEKGIPIDIEPNIGNSHTWQMWIQDPEGNRIEIMQYTDQSYQIVGNIDPILD